MAFGPNIDIIRKHSLPFDYVKQVAQNIAIEMESKYDINYIWDEHGIVFNAINGAAKGTSGRLDISDGELKFKIKLPVIFYALNNSITESIKEELDKYIGPELK